MLLSAFFVTTLTGPLWAQTTGELPVPTSAPSAPAGASVAAPAPIVNNRVFGVLPNYRTASLSDPYKPLSINRKFYIGYKDSTDYPIFALSAVLSGLGQWTNQHPSYGQGLKGYGKRYIASTAD